MSLNPAIDKRLTLATLELGRANRAATVRAAPGGKAAHVAMVLRILGANVMWIGFQGGVEGAALVNELEDLGIRAEGVQIDGQTRTNLEILEESGTITELLEPGPTVMASEIRNLLAKCEGLLERTGPTGTLILSGSLPPGAPADCYSQFIELGHRHRSKVFLDTNGEPLRCALQAKPDFVKINQTEASALIGMLIQDVNDAQVACRQIVGAGARSAAVTLGAKGLVWLSDSTAPAMYATPPVVKPVSPVGSGDAVLAGFAFGGTMQLDRCWSLQLAVACGAANCVAELPGRPTKDDIDRFREDVAIGTLDSPAKTGSLQSC